MDSKELIETAVRATTNRTDELLRSYFRSPQDAQKMAERVARIEQKVFYDLPCSDHKTTLDILREKLAKLTASFKEKAAILNGNIKIQAPRTKLDLLLMFLVFLNSAVIIGVIILKK